MNYTNELIKLASNAIKNGDGQHAGCGMFNFEITLPKVLGEKYMDEVIFQIYPLEGDYHGDIWLLPYYKIDKDNYDHDDIAFYDLDDNIKKKVYESFKERYGTDNTPQKSNFVASGVLTFTPYINTDKIILAEEFYYKVKDILSKVEGFDEFDLAFSADVDYRCERDDSFTESVKSLLEEKGFDNIESIKSAQVTETKVVDGNRYEYVYIDWDEKGPDDANFALIYINGTPFIPMLGYPMSLADSRSYMLTNDYFDYYIMDSKYRMNLASTPLDGKQTDTLLYNRLVALNHLDEPCFNGVILVKGYSMGIDTDVIEFYDAMASSDYENGCGNEPILYRAYFKPDETIPNHLEKIETLF